MVVRFRDCPEEEGVHATVMLGELELKLNKSQKGENIFRIPPPFGGVEMWMDIMIIMRTHHHWGITFPPLPCRRILERPKGDRGIKKHAFVVLAGGLGRRCPPTH